MVPTLLLPHRFKTKQLQVESLRSTLETLQMSGVKEGWVLLPLLQHRQPTRLQHRQSLVVLRLVPPVATLICLGRRSPRQCPHQNHLKQRNSWKRSDEQPPCLVESSQVLPRHHLRQHRLCREQQLPLRQHRLLLHRQ